MQNRPTVYISYIWAKLLTMKTMIELLRRYKKRIAYVLTTLCMLFLGLFLGLLIGPNKDVEYLPQPTQKLTSVSMTVKTLLKANFAACSHEIVTVGGESLVGKTREEAEIAYPGWTLVSFENSEAVFEKTFLGYCPAHYILRLEDEELGIYRTDETTYTEKRLMVLDYDADALDDAERAELERGLAFDDLNGINAYLESAES
jgi:hypothetical protein